MFNWETQLIHMMVIMIVVLVIALLFMGSISIYVRRTRYPAGEDFHFEHLYGAAVGRWSVREPPGLDSAVIHTFPTFLYSSVKGLKIGKGGLECAVCISEFEDAETLRFIPMCSHVFHMDCIDAWLVSNVTCPVCRADLAESRSDQQLVLFPDQEIGHHSDSDDCIPSNNIISDHVRSDDPISHSNDRKSHSSRWSTFTRLFPRSHSTGHASLQGDPERFTLRLPEDVRNKLMSTELNRAKSCSVVFTRARSGRKGFRNEHDVGSYNQKFDIDIENSSVRGQGLPPLPPKIGSSVNRTSAKRVINERNVDDSSGSVPRRSSKSIRSSFDRFLLGLDSSHNSEKPIGERSFDRLRLADNEV
ncbi:RING-H2 finger protein ATL11 [Linum grandiflorum]